MALLILAVGEAIAPSPRSTPTAVSRRLGTPTMGKNSIRG